MSLRVLHVVATDQRRGAEVFAADLVRSLDELGVAQLVVTIRPGWGGVAYVAETAELMSGNPRPAGPSVHARAVLRLRRLVRTWKPDVVQAHGGEALKNCVAARVERQAPLVYRRIGGAPRSLRSRPRRDLYRWLMGRSRRIVSLAEAITRETIALFDIEPWRVVTIPNGVDRRRLDGSTGRSGARKRLGLAPHARVLLSLAALTWEKDPIAHLDVASRVLKRCPDAVHLFAGDGPMSRDVHRRIASLGLGDRIRLLGARGDVPDLMSASDVLLFASRPDGMEGMPTIMIEAGMSSLPVAGFDVAGAGEVVIEGETGVLVPWGAREELGDAALAILIDDERRRSLGTAARRACIERFDVSQLTPRYLGLYEELAGADHGA